MFFPTSASIVLTRVAEVANMLKIQEMLSTERKSTSEEVCKCFIYCLTKDNSSGNYQAALQNCSEATCYRGLYIQRGKGVYILGSGSPNTVCHKVESTTIVKIKIC